MYYSEAIEYLESLPSPEKWGLQKPHELAKLSNLQTNYEIIHVAGTNGKGSVCSFIAKVLESAGYRVGIYTSPHLQRYNERIQINGREISNSEFSNLMGHLKPITEKMKKAGNCPSLFEALTIAALHYFSSKKIDFAVLETGLGGRLDATNIVKTRVQVLTRISRDHKEHLGGNIASIAREKSGIIKSRSLVIAADSPPAALKEIEKKCRQTHSSLFQLGKGFRVKNKAITRNGSEFDYSGVDRGFPNLRISLLGEHQLENAALAVACVDALVKLHYSVSERAIREGLKKTSWPGRLEVMGTKPLILLDGAHNVGGVRCLKKALQDIFLRNKKGRLILVFGAMKDKEFGIMLNDLSSIAAKIILTSALLDRSAPPDSLAKVLKKNNPQPLINPKVQDAIRSAERIATENDVICITGSLYVVGEARTHLLKTSK